MPVTQEENNRYGNFVREIATKLGIFDFQDQTILWHYTDGKGLLGILESGHLNATQVSSLNDAMETQFATDLYRNAIERLLTERAGEAETVSFLKTILGIIKDEPEVPTQGTSEFFVACFSAAKDDINQWTKYTRHDQGQYAIGFHSAGLNREPNSILHKVVYDRGKLEDAAGKVAEATVQFFKEGLTGERVENPDEWGREFFAAWDAWIYKLAPIAKDARWQSEREYRIVHALRVADMSKVRFSQKRTMLSRYIALDFPCWVKDRVPRLPIAALMIGPAGHPFLTRVSVRLLLEQMGYGDVPVEISTCTLTER